MKIKVHISINYENYNFYIKKIDKLITCGSMVPKLLYSIPSTPPKSMGSIVTPCY
jgi:hypothetical protein